ncbi:MAG: helix-turn-helix domain-containing protein [Oscillospiraceae bacterium]|nr:helix-turn-helix domain-containing protein [Oscillospiraceae bacterium]
MADRASCKGCIYHRSLSGTEHGGCGKGCHYALDTGELRECPAENCNKKILRGENTVQGVQISENTRLEILKMRDMGMTIAEIVDTLGIVGRTTVQKVCAAAAADKAKKESVSADKPTDTDKRKVNVVDNNNIIPQKDDNVKSKLPKVVETAVIERLQTLVDMCNDRQIKADDFDGYMQEIVELYNWYRRQTTGAENDN